LSNEARRPQQSANNILSLAVNESIKIKLFLSNEGDLCSEDMTSLEHAIDDDEMGVLGDRKFNPKWLRKNNEDPDVEDMVPAQTCQEQDSASASSPPPGTHEYNNVPESQQQQKQEEVAAATNEEVISPIDEESSSYQRYTKLLKKNTSSWPRTTAIICQILLPLWILIAVMCGLGK
jgi:hypothetical protein